MAIENKTSVTISESVTQVVVDTVEAISIDLTEDITTVSINNLAVPAQATDGAGVGVTPYKTITATNVQTALEQLADQHFKSTDEPTGSNISEGDFWYETDTETLHVYREVSTGVFEGVPILLSTSDSDTLDGGSY